MLPTVTLTKLGILLGLASLIDAKCYILMPKEFYENQQDLSGQLKEPCSRESLLFKWMYLSHLRGISLFVTRTFASFPEKSVDLHKSEAVIHLPKNHSQVLCAVRHKVLYF